MTCTRASLVGQELGVRVRTCIGTIQIKHSNMDKVAIRAKSVVINKDNGKSKQEKNRRRKQKQKQKKQMSVQEEKISEMGPKAQRLRQRIRSAAPGTISDMGARVGTRKMAMTAAMSTEGRGWGEKYVDPAGVHHDVAGVKRVPDGAIPISLGGEVRYLETTYRPNQVDKTTDIGERNGSWMFILAPMLRALGIIIFNAKGLDFSKDVRIGFCRAWAQQVRNRESVSYPNWVSFSSDDDPTIDGQLTPVNYFTVCASTALSQIIAPSEAGDSVLISQFRFCSYGLVVNHNTPTLLDQGTCAMARFNTNKSKHTFKSDSVSGFNEFYMQSLSGGQGVVAIDVLSPAGEVIPVLEDFKYVGTLPSPTVTSEAQVRNVSGSLFIKVGDSFHYELISGFVNLVNDTSNQQLRLHNILETAQHSTRLYFRHIETEDDVTVVGEYEPVVTVISLPPFTQAEIMQANPDAVQQKLKDHEGFYLPNQAWEPVFNMTESSDYSKVVFSTLGFDINEASDLNTGWFDSVDQNFGISVANMQNVAYAASPLVKIMRGDEYVPSGNSVLGLFATATVEKDDIALLVGRDMMNALPHGLPAEYNGFGTLFSMVSSVMGKMSLAAAHTTNISRTVANVVNEVCDMGLALVEKRDPRLVY